MLKIDRTASGISAESYLKIYKFKIVINTNIPVNNSMSVLIKLSSHLHTQEEI